MCPYDKLECFWSVAGAKTVFVKHGLDFNLANSHVDVAPYKVFRP